jgi:hypothetical protein
MIIESIEVGTYPTVITLTKKEGWDIRKVTDGYLCVNKKGERAVFVEPTSVRLAELNYQEAYSDLQTIKKLHGEKE